MNKAVQFFAFISVFALAGLSGCFTEVGNPDDESQMTAQFSIDYSRNPVSQKAAATLIVDTASVQQFFLRVEGAVYHSTDSSQSFTGYVWQDSDDFTADFTGANSSAALPTATLKIKNVSDMEMKFGIPARTKITTDTIDFATFKDSGYVKGTYLLSGARTEFLFAFPDTVSTLNLKYSKAALDGWHVGDTYHCQFTFFAVRWLNGIDLTTATLLKDKSGSSLALFDSEHNVTAYKSMMAAFYQSFNTQIAY